MTDRGYYFLILSLIGAFIFFWFVEFQKDCEKKGGFIVQGMFYPQCVKGELIK